MVEISLELSVIALIVGFILYIIGREAKIEPIVNKILYVVGLILIVIGIIIGAAWLLLMIL